MPKKRNSSLRAVIAAFISLGLWFTPALGQNDQKPAAPKTLKQPPRLSVPFNHDAHNLKAQLRDCAVCHHGYRGGQRFTSGMSSTDKHCSDCHMVRPSGETPAPSLTNAYHKLCQGCHQTQGKGPVKCSQCHPKESGKAY